MNMRHLKLGLAVASFATAVALSFTSLLISEDHDIAANVLFVVAQFLTLCATILGIDYKFTHIEFSPDAKPTTSGLAK
jgi:hypothetical protein